MYPNEGISNLLQSNDNNNNNNNIWSAFIHSASQSVSLFVIHIVKGMWRIFSILSYQAHPFPSSTACLGRKRYEWQCRYTKRNQWNKHFAIHDDILLGKSGTSRAVVIAMASLPFHCHQNVSFVPPPSHHLTEDSVENALSYWHISGFFLLLVQMGSFSRFCF